MGRWRGLVLAGLSGNRMREKRFFGCGRDRLPYPGERKRGRFLGLATAITISLQDLVYFRVGRGHRHGFDLSSLGISLAPFRVPWVGIAPSTMFTQILTGWADRTLSAILAALDTFLNSPVSGTDINRSQLGRGGR